MGYVHTHYVQLSGFILLAIFLEGFFLLGFCPPLFLSTISLYQSLSHRMFPSTPVGYYTGSRVQRIWLLSHAHTQWLEGPQRCQSTAIGACPNPFPGILQLLYCPLVCLKIPAWIWFIWGFTSLSTLYRSYHDG